MLQELFINLAEVIDKETVITTLFTKYYNM